MHGNRLAEYGIGKQHGPDDGRPLPHEGIRNRHPSDNLLPQNSIDAYHANSSTQQQYILPRKETLHRRKLREDPSEGIYQEGYEQEYMTKQSCHVGALANNQ